MYVLLKLHRIVQASAVATRLTARILGARTRHSHGIRNTCARQIRGVVAAAVVDDMRRALWIRKQALKFALAHLLLLNPPWRVEEARQPIHLFVDILVADNPKTPERCESNVTENKIEIKFD